MKENRFAPESREQVTDRFSKVVARASENDEMLSSVNTRVYELPRTRIGVLHSPHQPMFSVFIQPRQILRDGGPYIHYELKREDSGPNIFTMRRKNVLNHRPLEEVLETIAISAEHAADKKMYEDAPQEQPDLTDREIAVVLEIVGAARKGEESTGREERKHYRQAEKWIGKLRSYLREPIWGL